MPKFVVAAFLFLVTNVLAQNNNEMAIQKAREAVKLMDEGKLDESIQLLEESQHLDPENYVYPYEIAYAHVLKKDYGEAVAILLRTKEYKTIHSQVFQMLGNCYSYLGRPEEAIKEYEEGIKKFPKAGNLHLEKGNIYLAQKKYEEAIKSYENGIQVDPVFPSNYYRLALLYLNSNDKLSGLIYGEIFMNLERTTARTQEMSVLLYNSYKNSISLGEGEAKIDFCEIVVDAADIKDGKLQLPLCAIFAKNFILATINQKEFTLNSISAMRTKFIQYFFTDDFQEYTNVLFDYHKRLVDEEVFDAYSHYLFQIAVPEEFKAWKEQNEEKYEQFVKWYTQGNNALSIGSDNFFIR